MKVPAKTKTKTKLKTSSPEIGDEGAPGEARHVSGWSGEINKPVQHHLFP